ncbi:MAG TPA: hypothetical protein VGS21_06075 [Acidimicrobiales bacterium]|nr:hypothetical protein [Acidimicrobiales bacterium]
MGGLFEKLTKNLVRKGLREGLVEGSTLWLALGALAFLVRFMGRPEEPKVATESLRLGESITITHLPAPPSRRQQRRTAKATRRAGDTTTQDA